MSHILFDRVQCVAPDGRALFPQISASISAETVGLFGRNGCGKTTLLRAFAGNIAPMTGAIHVDGKIALLRQESFLAGATVVQALGVDEQLAIQRRFDEGRAQDADFDQVDWALLARLDEVLSSCGQPNVDTSRIVDSLSGGERNRLKIAALLLEAPDILLLDEPTNNLDAAGRPMIFNLMERLQGPMLVAIQNTARAISPVVLVNYANKAFMLSLC